MEIVEPGVTQDLPSRIFDIGLGVFIVLNAIAVSLETVPSLEAAYGGFFTAFELLSVTLFGIEYIVRVWTAVDPGTPIEIRP